MLSISASLSHAHVLKAAEESYHLIAMTGNRLDFKLSLTGVRCTVAKCNSLYHSGNILQSIPGVIQSIILLPRTTIQINACVVASLRVSKNLIKFRAQSSHFRTVVEINVPSI
ncbi:hypothetical protein SUGI_0935960 [Cryptomeria japonica]|nr:hypothetical protein SUGI_0935960 [Cryptomeria japonica]